MDAIAPAIIGIGIYLMYEAFKNTSPTPIAKIKNAITGASSADSTVTPLGGAGSANQPETVPSTGQEIIPGASVQPN